MTTSSDAEPVGEQAGDRRELGAKLGAKRDDRGRRATDLGGKEILLDGHERMSANDFEDVRSVAARVERDPDPYAIVAALLHDTVEKSSMTWDDLRAAGADDRLIALVDALTARDGEPEHEYLRRAAADPLTLRIKRADLIDKFDLRQRSILNDDAQRMTEQRARPRLAILEELAIRHGTA